MMEKMNRVLLFLVGIFVVYLLSLDFFGARLCPLRSTSSQNLFPKPSAMAFYGQTYAIPAFSRKYTVDCQACHTAFPNLTPFGEAFKHNGLRFPGEGSSFDSPDTISLGNADDKNKFPKSVWPGALPKSLPIGFVASSEFVSDPKDGATNQKNQFQGIGGKIALLTAGTAGSHFGFWAETEFEVATDQDTGARTVDVGAERIFAVVNPFDKPSLVIRVGSFEPHLTGVSEHRSLLGDYFLTGAEMVGDNGFTLDGSQQGIEFGGIVAQGRLGYTAAVVEGTGNKYNNNKDFYGRVEYKLGGLRLDGVQNKKSTTKTNPWRDDSIIAGAFAYQGFATVTDTLTEQNDRFEIYGADLEINYFNFLSNIVYSRRQDNQPLLADPTTSLASNNIMGELDYDYYWFLPGIRYEYFDNSQTKDHRVTVGSTFLIRPNIKTYVRGSLFKPQGGNFTDNPEIRAGLVLGW